MGHLSRRVGTLLVAVSAGSVLALSGRQPLLGVPKHDTINGRFAAGDHVIVKFRSTPSAAQLTALAGEADADAPRPIGGGRAHLVRSRSKRVAQLVAELSKRADLEYVEPDYVEYPTAAPNDPSFGLQWALRNVGQNVNGAAGTAGADVHAVAAWNIARGAANAVIGIVDTGFDYTHPDLAGNVWAAPHGFSVTIGGQTIACAAGSHGFQSTDGAMSCDPGAPGDHGTHVAGIAGASGNNQQGVAGVAWRTSMMSLNFMTRGYGYDSDAVNLIEFAVQVKSRLAGSQAGNVRVLNTSWGGGGFSQALQDEIDRAAANDMLVVAAAGNSSQSLDSTPFYPASYARPNMLVVASTNSGDQLSPFSDYGASTVHLAAPGENIFSTLPQGGYGYLSGTSMAAPMVSGAAALVLSRCAMSTPDLKTLILNSVDHVAPLAGRTITGGRLNAANALTTCAAGAADAPPSISLTAPTDGAVFNQFSTIQIAASASDSDGSVSQVDFYAGPVVIRSVTTPPYVATWSNPAAGTYQLTAVATDDLGAQTRSDAATVTVAANNNPQIAPWQSQDVGSTGLAGDTSYANGTFTVRGAGADIWGTADSFQFASQSLTGDGQIVARVTSETYANAYAKAGVMIRESTAANAAHVILDVRPTGDVEFMTRTSTGSATRWVSGAVDAPPTWLRLSRSGSTITGALSADGASWQTIGSVTVSMGATALIGLAVTSHNPGAINTATFDNVAVSAGLPPPWTSQDVGSPGRSGAAAYANATFTVQGAGADIWGAADGFQFVNQPLNGDGQIVARIASVTNTNPYAKAGVMIRESAAANAAHVVLDVRPTGDVEFMSRRSTGAATTWIAGAFDAAPTWVRLTRAGATITGAVSSDGSSWQTIGSATVSMNAAALVGLAVTSHDPSLLNVSTFDSVAVSAGMPAPWSNQDVGTPGRGGSAAFDGATFTVRGAGADIWGAVDGFHFVSEPLAGDGQIVARVTSVTNTSPYAKAGVMIRESTAANAAHVILDVRPTNDIEFMTRSSTGAATSWVTGAVMGPPAWLRLQRVGGTVTAAVSYDGATWQTVGSVPVSMSASTVIGLAVTSHDPASLNTATFDNVAAGPPK